MNVALCAGRPDFPSGALRIQWFVRQWRRAIVLDAVGDLSLAAQGQARGLKHKLCALPRTRFIGSSLTWVENAIPRYAFLERWSTVLAIACRGLTIEWH
jgi:hypothetical protein